MRNTQIRCRVSGEHSDMIQAWSKKTGLQQLEIASMLLYAALEACREEGVRVPFPVHFKISEPEAKAARYELNEPRPKK